jgi:two-component system, NtrC family, response regulator PilR
MSAGLILVVDDDEAIQTFVSMSLENEGYTVTVASDGLAALQSTDLQQPALILLDMRMPKMDGPTFISAYQNRPGPHAPIIIMTAARNTDDAAIASGIIDVLAKPFDLEQLLDLIQQHV